ncbi:MAG: hypothetical protein ACKO96_07510, partial [Flammeovirgaceae bacterium]
VLFFLLISFTLIFSIFSALCVVIDPFLQSLGFGEVKVSVTGGLFVLAGIASSLIFGLNLDKHRKYLWITRCLCFGTFLMVLACQGTFLVDSHYLVGACTVIIGALVVPISPVGISFAGELTFPIQEAIVVGIV